VDPGQPFLYSPASNDRDVAGLFCQELKDVYRIGPTLFVTKGVATAPGVLWTSAAWIHSQSQSIIFVRNNAFDSVFTRETGYYYVGWLKIPESVKFFSDVLTLNAADFSPANFTACVQDGYVDLYYAASISDCNDWVKRFRGKTFEIRSPGANRSQAQAKFESPQLACTTCNGIHKQEICPVQASEDSGKPRNSYYAKLSLKM